MQAKAFYKGQRFIKRSTGQRVQIVEIKQVIVRHGRTEQLSNRYRMSGANEFITVSDLLKQYDEEQAETQVEGTTRFAIAKKGIRG